MLVIMPEKTTFIEKTEEKKLCIPPKGDQNDVEISGLYAEK